MVKPRGKVTRSTTPRAAYARIGEPEIEITAWCPDPAAMEPPEQVHFIMHLKGLAGVPLVLRYKSPDSLGFFIEELIRYRKFVWPEAEPIDPAVEFKKD